MTFTGQLGTVNSRPGNILLGQGPPAAQFGLGLPPVFSQVLPIRGVPWARFLPPFFDPRINPPVPPGSASTPPAYRLNIPGVPWLPHPVPPAITNPVIVPPAPSFFQPAWMLPIRGVPWAFPFGALAGGSGGASPSPPPPPPPPPGPPGIGQLLLLSRVPKTADVHEYVRRLARHSEILSDMFNSLVRQGILIRSGLADWSINASSGGGGLTGTFP